MATYKHNPNQNDAEYRATMEIAMENLAANLESLGYPAPRMFSDEDMIKLAVKKLNTLTKLVLSTGVNENLLKIIMAE